MKNKGDFSYNLNCAFSLGVDEVIQLAHGGGGAMMKLLLEEVFFPVFSNPLLDAEGDAAVFELPANTRLAMSTDSFVVTPLFFPGGDIGKLAVYGVVNDLAMVGAQARYLNVTFILEEGLSIEVLRQVVSSMGEAAKECGVKIIAGDTKVVGRGKGDGIFISTTAFGVLEHELVINPSKVSAGDAVLVSGDIGRHGMAVLSKREGLEFESSIESDCSSLWPPVKSLLDAGLEIHCMRDATRGGIATVLSEIANSSHTHILLKESEIPVRQEVCGACEILGLDPIYIANEGCMVVFVAEKDSKGALEILRKYRNEAKIIGRVENSPAGIVTMVNSFGASRIIDLLSGEQLPRIC